MPRFFSRFFLGLLLGIFLATVALAAPAPAAADSITFTNGDHLTGTFVRENGGSVVFHSDIAGDITVPWAKVKELKTAGTFAVLKTGVAPKRKQGESQIPIGTLAVTAGKIQLTKGNRTSDLAPIPVADAAYIIDKATLDKQLLGHPGFFAAWNGSATGGFTLVNATQNQYTVTAAIALQRAVPTVDWLNPRNKTSVELNESFGKITEPAYLDPATGDVVASTYTKSNILSAGAERDEYISKRLYYLGQAAFDHNYAQSLQLEQIYGGGVGYTMLKTPKESLDVTGTVQYERQSFFNTATANQDLIGSTLAAVYNANLLKGIKLNQQLEYVPAFNNARAYSANETDTVTFPAYKNFGFSVGTIDSYLNDAPVTLPLTRRNSFQFTLGVTYALKSKY